MSVEIVDPKWRPNDAVVARLNQSVAQSIKKRPGQSTVFAPGEREALSGRLAMEATMTMLAPVASAMPVINAEDIRVNMPGYDILVGDRLRIQVKGGTFVDLIGTAFPPDLTSVKLDFDVMVMVDIGAVLDPRPYGARQDGRDAVPVKPFVDFYVVPVAIVRDEIARAAYVNKRGAHLYFYKQRLKPGSKEHAGQWFDLPNWRGRFDVIERALLALV